MPPPEAKSVAIIMGSQSDWQTMKHAAETLDALDVAYATRIVSAHRTPERLYAFAKGAKAQGFKVIIAGAGGAAPTAVSPRCRQRVEMRLRGRVSSTIRTVKSCQ